MRLVVLIMRSRSLPQMPHKPPTKKDKASHEPSPGRAAAFQITPPCSQLSARDYLAANTPQSHLEAVKAVERRGRIDRSRPLTSNELIGLCPPSCTAVSKGPGRVALPHSPPALAGPAPRRPSLSSHHHLRDLFFPRLPPTGLSSHSSN